MRFDNGGADAKANSMIAEENQHCVVHTTNLIANGALDEKTVAPIISEALKAGRGLVGYFNRFFF